jgi:hypothetical protein
MPHKEALQEVLTKGHMALFKEPVGHGRGIPREQIIEYWGRNPECSLISPLESPSMLSSLSSNFRLFQAGSIYLESPERPQLP